MNYRRWLIVGYVLVLMAFTTSVLLIPGQKYDTLTTSDSGWVYDTAVEIDKTNALAENNPLSHAPYGLSISLEEQVQPLVTVMIYRGISALNPSVTLMDVVKYWAPLIFALSLIPIFLIGKELGGDVGGIASVFFAATLVSSIYWHKIGAYDREPIQLILGAWAMFLTIKLFKAPRHSIPKFALLAGMVYGLFGLAWAGWHHVIAIAILGLLFVLLVGFFGRFLRKTSDLFGAFFSTIRGHLGLIVGVVGMMVVITLVFGVLGGQSPLFWVGVFGTYTGYIGLGGGGGGGVSFTRYASEMQTPSSFGDVFGKFYGAEILTTFILILIGVALAKFIWSRKRWEILTFSWLIVLVAMVWPGAGQARFARLWWPFVPVLAGVGAATLVSLVRQFSFDPSGAWLKHFQNPIVLILVMGIIAAPFVVNAYDTAHHTTPPTEWRVRGLDEAFMETFDWFRENTPENSVVSIQWSFGHLFTGTARRAAVTDGAEIRAEEGKWENDLSFVPRPPDYIYYVEDSSGFIYGVDVTPKSFGVNGRRIDVQYLPMVGEDEFRWLITTYRDNYGCKIDYVIFSAEEYSRAFDYYQSTQPINILLGAERISTPSQLQPSVEDQNYVFNFGENREAVVLDAETRDVYLRTDNGNLSMDGYGVLKVDKQGRISDYAGFFPPSSTPDIQETLLIFFDEGDDWVSAWLVEGVSAKITARPVPMGIRIFTGNTEDIDYLQIAFTSSNDLVNVIKINHVPSPVSPADSAMINDNTPEFQWSGAIGASRYELWVDNNADFSSPEIQVDNLINPTYTAVVTFPDGDYFWRVGAYDSENGLLGWSETSAFTIDTQAPSQPQLSEPQDNAELSTLGATFRWTEPEPNVTYEIQIDDENGFTSPYVYDNTGITDNSHTYILPMNGVYYWRVRARDTAGNASEWSSTFTLTIRAPPQAPTPSSPENGTFTNDNTPGFEWTGGNGDNYRLLLDNDLDFSSPDENCIIDPSATAYTIAEENSLSDGTYSWKVVAIVGDTENSSPVWTFTVDTVAPEAPALYAPENGVDTDNSTPTLEWSLSPDADNYHLIIDTEPEFGSPDIDFWPTENTYTPPAELIDENYYWKVIAVDAAGNENTSSTWTFRIVSPGG